MPTTKTICSWGVFPWNGTDYTTTIRGNPAKMAVPQTTKLDVTPKPADAVTAQTICSGESFS
jgi:hypothetical protein